MPATTATQSYPDASSVDSEFRKRRQALATTDAVRRDGAAATEIVRTFHYSRGAVAESDDDNTTRRTTKLGWVFWLVLDMSLLFLPVPIVVMGPPIMACRQIDRNVGFYAGESFITCAKRGVSERWALLDSRLKMAIRQSGR